MKRISRIAAIVVSLMLLAFAAYAEMPTVPTGQSACIKPQVVHTLLSAVTATGDGSGYSLRLATGQHTCMISVGGTAPTNVVVALKGSIDGTVYAPLATQTYTIASPDTAVFSVSGKSVTYIKGNYTSKSGGDGTTSVTLKCLSGGN